MSHLKRSWEEFQETLWDLPCGTEDLPLDKIRLDGFTQQRIEINQETVDDYTEYYATLGNNYHIPLIEVFFDGANYWLVDGFHRRAGAIKAGLKNLSATVFNGTLEEAQWYSYQTNKDHGLRRSSEDKAKAVKAALKHVWGVKLSDLELAAHVGVSDKTVAKYRRELSATSEIPKSKERTGRDGRTIDVSNIGKSKKVAEAMTEVIKEAFITGISSPLVPKIPIADPIKSLTIDADFQPVEEPATVPCPIEQQYHGKDKNRILDDELHCLLAGIRRTVTTFKNNCFYAEIEVENLDEPITSLLLNLTSAIGVLEKLVGGAADE